MVSALFTALALIAAGQGGSFPAGPAATQIRSNGTSEHPPVQARSRAAKAAYRRNG